MAVEEREEGLLGRWEAERTESQEVIDRLRAEMEAMQVPGYPQYHMSVQFFMSTLITPLRCDLLLRRELTSVPLWCR